MISISSYLVLLSSSAAAVRSKRGPYSIAAFRKAPPLMTLNDLHWSFAITDNSRLHMCKIIALALRQLVYALAACRNSQ